MAWIVTWTIGSQCFRSRIWLFLVLYFLVEIEEISIMIPVHGAYHEEAVPELLGDVGQVSRLRAHHTPVVNQAVLINLCEKLLSVHLPHNGRQPGCI